MGYVSAVLHLEPWTPFLLFEWFPVLVPVSFLFPRHRGCCSRVQVFIRLQLSELCTPAVLPKGNGEILAGLHQSGRGRCSSSGPKREEGSCLEEWHVSDRKTLLYLSFYQGLPYITSRGCLWAEQKAGRGNKPSQELRTSLVFLNKGGGWGYFRDNE